jgi:biotin carboxyl carrier protein
MSQIVNNLNIDKMNIILSEVTGTVWKIEAPVGTRVAEGDTIVIVESMKMEIPLCAPCAGVVREVHVAEGEAVMEDQSVAVLGP